jgi:hypothetical protein
MVRSQQEIPCNKPGRVDPEREPRDNQKSYTGLSSRFISRFTSRFSPILPTIPLPVQQLHSPRLGDRYWAPAQAGQGPNKVPDENCPVLRAREILRENSQGSPIWKSGTVIIKCLTGVGPRLPQSLIREITLLASPTRSHVRLALEWAPSTSL